MLSTNITNFRKQIFDLFEQTVKYNETIHVRTKDGDAILLSAEDYNGLMETLYLSSIPTVREAIIDGLRTPAEDCLREDEVEW